MAITHYDKYMEPAASKGKFAAYPDSRADSFPAASEIEYGVAVELTGKNNDRVQTFQGGSPHGIALAREYYDYRKDNPSFSYKAQDEVPVVRKGVIWAEVTEDISAGDKVVADNSTGNFRTSTEDSSSTVGVEVSGAVFKSSANAGELAKVELNLP